jgi:hypothetical protein
LVSIREIHNVAFDEEISEEDVDNNNIEEESRNVFLSVMSQILISENSNNQLHRNKGAVLYEPTAQWNVAQ